MRQVTGDELARILGYIDEEGGLREGGVYWDAAHSAIVLEALGDLLSTMTSYGLEHPGAQAAIGDYIASLSRRISVEPMRHAVVVVPPEATR